MNFNPLMLLPLIMGGKNGGDADMTKMLETDSLHFYPGVSYRHCLIINHGVVDDEVTPPHDITGRKIKDYLPKGVYKDLFLDLYEKSYALLENHPINEKRKKELFLQ